MSRETGSFAFFGSIGAAVCSLAANHSIIWMLIHMCCSWLYVLYFFFIKYGKFSAALEVLKMLFS